jgi:hypothetical protein
VADTIPGIEYGDIKVNFSFRNTVTGVKTNPTNPTNPTKTRCVDFQHFTILFLPNPSFFLSGSVGIENPFSNRTQLNPTL